MLIVEEESIGSGPEGSLLGVTATLGLLAESLAELILCVGIECWFTANLLL